uniref:Uncharacterized protein n=1 Tax=Anguilla anguilla TaxID=7936 RepID=A0A0E9WFL6_ANGAN
MHWPVPSRSMYRCTRCTAAYFDSGLLNIQDLRPILKAHRPLLICLCWIVGFVKNNEHLMLQNPNNGV